MSPGPQAAGDGTDQPEIVPRWEWRTFGEPLDSAEAVLAAQAPDMERESDEVYLLSVGSDASVKVRDGLMDVKQLLEVDDAGLELWCPVLKGTFPLPAADVATVLGMLNVEVPALTEDVYPLDVFEATFVRQNAELVATPVHKRRTHYLVDGCMVELSHLTTSGLTVRTVAVESPDPSLVSATIRKLGLEGRSNECVARGLKALLRFGRYAAIDVGTNSVKLDVRERQADGRSVTVVDRVEMTRLGEGQGDDGLLAPAAIARTVDAITAMIDEARRYAAVAVVAVGTAGLRRAPNRDALVDAVRVRRAVTVQVISGEEEARLAYLAATSALPSAQGRLVVFDSGGGSTQLTFGEGRHIDEQFSVDVGAVRVAERFGLAAAVSPEALSTTLAGVASDLARLDDRAAPDAIVAIGGTATNLAAVKHGLVRYDPDVVHGTVLDLAEIDRQIELYRTRSADERRKIPGLQPARAEVILAGACIVRTILTKLEHESLTVSDRGLRHGVLIELAGA